MSPKMISFLAWMWVVGTFVSLIFQGAFFSTDEMNTLNYLTGTSTLQVGGIWGIPRMATGFFIHGLPRLLMWDFGFLQGGWAILQFVLIAVFSVPAIWGIITLFSSVLSKAL